MIELSKYFGDNNNTEATIYRDANGFFATVVQLVYTTRQDLIMKKMQNFMQKIG